MIPLLLTFLAGNPTEPAASELPSSETTPTSPSVAPPSSDSSAPAAPADIVITVDGMVCSFCVQGVERTMRRIDGVADVALSLESKTISLWMKPDGTVEDAFLRDQIKASGFDARDIVREPPTPAEPNN
jgi:copper chaperone CopZ